MTQETDAPQGGAEGVAAPEVVETTPEATTGQPEAAAEEAAPADDAGDEAEEPVKKVPWFQKRINEVTAKVYEKERQIAYLEGQLASSPKGDPQPVAEVFPTKEQYDWDDDKWMAAVVEHTRKETERALESKLSERDRSRSEQQKNDDAIARLKTGGANIPDFLAAVSGIQATEAVRDFALDDPNAATVLYELGKDSAAAARFNSLSPVQQAIELGKRAATPKPVSPRTIAPPPPETVAGIVAGIGKTPEDMSFEEFKAWREADGKT